MTTTAKSILAALVAALTGLAALDVTGILPVLGELLPPSVVKAIATVPTLAAILVHAIAAMRSAHESGPSAGQGGVNLLLVAGVAALMLPSCAGIVSGLTGQPVPSIAVQRAGQPGAPVIQVSAADLAAAELGDPATVHGLYNAGQVAAAVAEIVDSGK